MFEAARLQAGAGGLHGWRAGQSTSRASTAALICAVNDPALLLPKNSVLASSLTAVIESAVAVLGSNSVGGEVCSDGLAAIGLGGFSAARGGFRASSSNVDECRDSIFALDGLKDLILCLSRDALTPGAGGGFVFAP